MNANAETAPNHRTLSLSYMLLVSVVAALGGLLFGFDTAVISGTIPFITPYFALDEFTLGWAVSSILLGCGVGAIIAGPLAETYGRRFVLFVCALLFALSGVGVGLSESLSIFVLFRLVGGLGVGAAAVVSPMYIAEIVPPAWRGRLVSLYQLAIVSGILLAYITNFLLADLGENNWRWMFAAQAAPAVLFFLMLWLVPETPRWLVKQGRIDQAAYVLERVGGKAFSQHEIVQIQASFRQEGATSELSLLLAPRYLPIVWMGVMIAIFQQVTGINAILYYAPTIFQKTGLDASNALLQTIGIGLVNLLSVFLAIGLVDKVGRKRLLLFGSVLMGLSLLLIAICFRYQYFDHYVVLLATLTYVGSFGCTLGAVTWVYLSEIFPNRIRGLAMSVATLALWLADFVVTYTFPIMAKHLGTSTTLLTYAIFCAIAFGYIMRRIPETKGKSLEEIEAYLTQ